MKLVNALVAHGSGLDGDVCFIDITVVNAYAAEALSRAAHVFKQGDVLVEQVVLIPELLQMRVVVAGGVAELVGVGKVLSAVFPAFGVERV